MRRFISVEEVRELLAEYIPSFPVEKVPLAEAHGRILREPLPADRDIPPYDRVMMDGYALRVSEQTHPGARYRIEAIAPAGSPPPVLADPLTGCIEIMTGAMLPRHCDCIIPVEDVVVQDGFIILSETATGHTGQHIHAMGSDHRQGATLLTPGRVLDAPALAIAASIGKTTLSVSVLPRVVIISTGNELVEIEATPEPWQIRSFNQYGITAALTAMGITEIKRFSAVDTRASLEKAIRAAMDKADLLLLCGGVSMGRYDLGPAVLADLLFRPVFHKIREKPGKPLWFGVHESCAAFGLPGNPVSTLVCLHRHIIPALHRAAGRTADVEHYAQLTAPLAFEPELTYFPPVRLSFRSDGTIRATPIGWENSGQYSILADSDGFAELDASIPYLPAGEPIRVYPWL